MSGATKVRARLPPLPSVKDLIQVYRLRALRQLSQNFLLDARLADKIVKAAGSISGGDVCEVGPGPGTITRAIIHRNPSTVKLVEKDERFVPALEMLAEASPSPVELIKGDILDFNMSTLFSETHVKPWSDRPPNVHLIGNLPFNVATPLIIRWIHAISERRSAWRYGRVKMTLTFQAEVAERMVSPIMTKSRCRLSVMCQNWCHVEHKFTIPGAAFVPPPKVNVGVVHFVPRLTPIIDLPFKQIEKVARSVFGYRQKYCIRGIETLFPPSMRIKLAERCLQVAEIDPKMRSFQLTLPEIGRICFAYNSILQDYPKLEHYNFRIHPDVLLDESEQDLSGPETVNKVLYDTGSVL